MIYAERQIVAPTVAGRSPELMRSELLGKCADGVCKDIIGRMSEPAAERRRLSGRNKRLIVVFAVGLLFLPYPTQVSPALNLQLVNEEGIGYGNRRVTWEGGFYAESFEELVRLDRQGRLNLPTRRIWMSPVVRFTGVIDCLMPHSGFRSSSACVYFEVPSQYELDPACVGPASPDGVWGISLQEGVGDRGQDIVCVSTDDPSHWGTSTCRLVLRPKSK